MAHVSAAPPRESSLLGKVFGASKMQYVDMDTQFGETQDHPSVGPAIGAAETSILSNGLSVTSTGKGSALAQVSITVNTGSRYEDGSNHGINSFYAAVAQKSTTNRSEFRMVRENHALANTINFTAGRETLTITATTLADHLPHAMGSLGDVLTNSCFHKHEIYPVKDMYKEFICEERERNPCQIEAIHAAAYRSNTLGNPLEGLSHHIDAISSYALQDFAKQVLVGPNMTLTASGVSHGALTEAVSETFASVDIGDKLSPSASQYTGGEVRIAQSGEDGLTHMTLGFQANPSDAFATKVLAKIVGGNVSSASASVVSSQCNAYYYSDSTLFTITGSALPSNGSALSDFLVAQSLSMAQISESQVAAATNVLKIETLLAGEDASGFDAVTAADVSRVATTLLQSPISSSAHGNLSTLPPQDLIKGNFPTLLA